MFLLLIQRFNNYGPDRRHMSCHFKKTVPYKLKPIKRAIMKRAMEMHKQALLKQQLEEEDGMVLWIWARLG